MSSNSRAKFKPGTLPGATAVNTATMTVAGVITPSISAPVTTTVKIGTATANIAADKNLASTEVVSGFPAIFNLGIIVTPTLGAVNLTNPQIVDRLPDSAIFIGAQGVSGVDWTYTPKTLYPPYLGRGGVITFTNLPTATVGIGVTRQITLQFDSTSPAPTT